MYSNTILESDAKNMSKILLPKSAVKKKKSKGGKLQTTTAEVESRGVCTTKEQLRILKNASSSSSNSTSNSSASSSPHMEAQQQKDSLTKRENHNKENPVKVGNSCEGTQTMPLQENSNSGAGGRERHPHHHGGHRRYSRQELDPTLRVTHSSRTQELVPESTTSTKQEIISLSIARQALEAEKVELRRLLDQRENIITELRKQMHHRDKTIQAQRTQFEDALRNIQIGKSTATVGDSPLGRSNAGGGGEGGGGGGTREELQLVRNAIISLRSNFRGTDPNQHTLDTLEQAIAVLIERCGGLSTGGGVAGGGGGGGGGGLGGGVGGGSNRLSNGVITVTSEKASRSGDKRSQSNGISDPSTKVIYFTERTVTPFMSTITKRLGDIRLRDFKNMFDRPGLFRFHFKSHDPEYGMVKEEIINDDDILPGVEGKIIAWVEEDND